MNNSKPSIKKNIFISTFYQVLLLIIPLITAPYVSRVLGPDGIGIYSYTQAYAMYASLFCALGTVSYGTREIARHREDKKKRSQLFWEIATLSVVTSMVCIVFWGVWTLINTEYRIYYMVLTFSLFGTMLDISWFYAGMEQFKYTVTQNSIFKIIGTIAIFTLVKEHDDLWMYILIMSLTTFLANASMWVYLPRFIEMVPIKSIRIKRHFRETLVYFIPTIATSIYTILDKTLIGLITHNTYENGYYEQATKIVNMAKTLSFSGVNVVLQSRISYLFAGDNEEEIKEKINLSMDFILFMGFGLTFGIIGISEVFVPWFFGPGYDKTIILLRMLSPLTIIVGISNCLGSQYYTPAGLRAQSAKYIVTGAVVNLACNLILIPQLASVGAAVATIIAEGVITVLYMKNNSGFYRTSTLLSQTWKKLLAGILMCFAMILIGHNINRPFTAILVGFVMGSALYVAVLLIAKDSFAGVAKNVITKKL